MTETVRLEQGPAMTETVRLKQGQARTETVRLEQGQARTERKSKRVGPDIEVARTGREGRE